MCERENHHRATTTTRAVVRCGAVVERVEGGRKATLGVTLFLRKFVKYVKHAAMHAKWQAKPGNQTTHQPFPAPFSHFPLPLPPTYSSSPLLLAYMRVIQPGKRSQVELTSRGIAYDARAAHICDINKLNPVEEWGDWWREEE